MGSEFCYDHLCTCPKRHRLPPFGMTGDGKTVAITTEQHEMMALATAKAMAAKRGSDKTDLLALAKIARESEAQYRADGDEGMATANHYLAAAYAKLAEKE